MTKKKEPNDYEKVGRPETITPEIEDKLITFFKMGLSDEEACEQTGVAMSVLYAHQNRHEEFRDRKKLAKTNLVARARRELFNGLLSRNEKIRVETAKWVLERKVKNEFSTRQEITGADGESLVPTIEIQPVKTKDK